MTQPDWSSTAHRLDNLAKQKFVQAWARVRHHVYLDENADYTALFLRGYMSVIENHIASEVGISESTLVGRLIDIGKELCQDKDAKDEGGSATG